MTDKQRFMEWANRQDPFPGGYCHCSCGPEHRVVEESPHYLSLWCRCHRRECWQGLKPCASVSTDWCVYARLDTIARRWLDRELESIARDNLERWRHCR